MLKRLLSGSLALVMILSAGCLSAFAEEEYDPTEEDPYCEYVPSEEGELSAREILGGILSDEEFVNSDNIMVQEMAEDMAELEASGTGIIGGEVADPNWIATPSDPTNGNTDHANLVKAVRDSLSKDYTEADKDQIIALMIFSANIADRGEFHNMDKNIPPNKRATQLHAKYGTNYLTNLKILWKYSKLAPSYNNTETENQIRSSMKKLNADDIDSMETLFDSIHTLYSVYKKEMNLNRALTKRERKYLVMGFALHLIGDIYAHATIVPKEYGIERTNNPYFNKADFSSSDAFNACMDKIVAANGINSFRTTEFKDYLKDPKNYNKYYEDNTKFMPERIFLAKLSSIEFISHIQTNGETFSPDYVLRYYKLSFSFSYQVTLAKFDVLKTRL